MIIPLRYELPLHAGLPTHSELPLQNDPIIHRTVRRQMLLPKIVGYFKMQTAKQINLLLGRNGQPFWQRNYYEHVVRNDRELEAISDYILANPANWSCGEDNL